MELAQFNRVRVSLVREETGGRPPVTVGGPEEAAEIARAVIGEADRETFLVLLLDTKDRVNAAHVAGVGTLDHCPVEPREVFKAAMLANAAAVIFAHNRPSGDPAPSPDDVAVTRRLAEAGALLGIEVLDRVVVGDRQTYSFRAAGALPPGGEAAAAGCRAHGATYEEAVQMGQEAIEGWIESARAGGETVVPLSEPDRFANGFASRVSGT